MRPVVLLSFDIEEFDIPLEYGQQVDFETQIQVSTTGLQTIIELLARLDITATFFTTTVFAKAQSDLMRRIAQKHEIASHGYAHSHFENTDLARSKQELETIVQKTIKGFRRARLATTDPKAIQQAGYIYDSSIHPIFLPGRYNHLDAPRTIYRMESLVEIPISTSPLLRIPLFWLAFKNFPTLLTRIASLLALRYDRYFNLFFHSWEFTDLSSYQLPRYVKRPDGAEFLHCLKRHLKWLKNRADFMTMEQFVEQWAQKQKK